MAGYQMLVRADVMRGKFRNSFEKPEPFVPDKVTKAEIRSAGRVPYVQEGTSSDGAGAEQLVPARRP